MMGNLPFVTSERKDAWRSAFTQGVWEADIYMSLHRTIATNLEKSGLISRICEETVAQRYDTPSSRPHSAFVVGSGIKAGVFTPLTASVFQPENNTYVGN